MRRRLRLIDESRGVERRRSRDVPVDEVGQVAGVGVAEEAGLEGVRLLAVGMREGPQDSVAATKPLLMPDKP